MFLCWFFVGEFEYVGGCVVIEEGVLGVVKDFDVFYVEDWECFEDGVFLDDVVDDDGDGL